MRLVQKLAMGITRKLRSHFPKRFHDFWHPRCFHNHGARGTSADMIENLTTTPQRSPETVLGEDREDFWAEHLQPDLPAGIVFQASVYDGTEQSDESWAVALGLAQSQLRVQLVPLSPHDNSQRFLRDSLRPRLERLTHCRVDLAKSILFHSGTPTSWNLDFFGRCRVGRTTFGTDRIPDGWAERCNAMDEVWVPSEFDRETFASSGVDARKIRVIRTGVDTRLFRPGLQPLDIPHTRTFNFLSVTSAQRRSGTDVLLRAYLREFKRDEDVALVLNISEGQNFTADPVAEIAFFIETELGVRIENTPTILFLGAPLSHADRSRLYASANAFVLPSRAEACGRSCLEALASGLPVIATRWGGASESLNDDNSFQLEIERLVPASAEDELVAGHRWAEPSVDHLRQLMREVFTNSQEARKRAEQARKDAAEHWDWSVVIPQWVDEFRRLYE